MQHPALMVVFASSLFKGPAKDWWVHLWDEYKYNPAEGSNYNNEDNNAPFNRDPDTDSWTGTSSSE